MEFNYIIIIEVIWEVLGLFPDCYLDYVYYFDGSNFLDDVDFDGLIIDNDP